MRWLELNADGVVMNIVVWDGVKPYAPDRVAQLLRCDENSGVSYGWRIVNGGWQAPPEEPPIEESQLDADGGGE